jgi:hypothetical protein
MNELVQEAIKSMLPESKLHENKNVLRFGPFKGDYKGEKVFVNVRYDDTCKNGHNSFAITVDIYENGRDVGGGCQHELVAKLMPELAHMIKWHLTSTDGPLHYVANSMYWAELGNLESARRCAVWPDAELEDFTEGNLLQRLPKLMGAFKEDIEALGLEY